MKKLYPESKVELSPFIAKHYDAIMNFLSLGLYDNFIHKAIADAGLKPHQNILDLGAGSGKNAFIMLKYIGKNAHITGMDISPEMEHQFMERFKFFPNINFIRKRIDEPFKLEKTYDVVFISFVLHGFPNDVRKNIIQNAYNNLKIGGKFIILDFAEFSLEKMPFYYRIPFVTIECKYAFDFIKRDWKEILSQYGFGEFNERHYIKNYARLLKAKKIG